MTGIGGVFVPRETPPAALLLDLDGVLVDTETPALAALAATFAAYGAAISPEDVIRRFRGKNLDRCPDEVAEALAEPLPPEFIPEARQRARTGPPPRAERGAAQLLAAPVPRRIVTNSTLTHSQDTLRSAGLGPVVRRDEIVAVDRVERPKPAPDLYLAALADLGLAARDCLAVEDSVTGLRAARAAGVPAVGYAADEQHRRELTRAGFPTISHLAELWEGTP